MIKIEGALLKPIIEHVDKRTEDHGVHEANKANKAYTLEKLISEHQTW